jgi:hypothetical protein
MKKFKSYLQEKVHTHQNDSKLDSIDDAYSKAQGSRSYKVINQDRKVVLTTDGIGNTKYLFRKELVQALRRLVYGVHRKSDYAISPGSIDFSKDKKWSFLINNRPVATGAPKDIIEFLTAGPLREEVEDDEERNAEREDKPKLFVIIDKDTERKHSSHRSRVDADRVLNKMDPDDRKKYKVQITEAAYRGNVGFEELYHFNEIASVKEKGELDNLIRTKKFKDAWALVQRVTKTKLVGTAFG